MKKTGSFWLVLLACVTFSCGGIDAHTAEAKAVKASVSAKQISVGKQVSIRSATEQVHYQSSDSTVASVSEQGVVTGKQAGRVKITVKRQGYQPKEISLVVRAAKGKPSLEVALDEVRLQSVKMKKTGDHRYQYSAVVQNKAEKGKIAKIEYYYRIRVQEPVSVPVQGKAAMKSRSSLVVRKNGKKTNAGDTTEKPGSEVAASALPMGTSVPTASPVPPVPTAKQEPQAVWETKYKTVVLSAKNIRAQKKSARIRCEGDVSGKASAMQLTQIKLYTGEAVYTYEVSRNKKTLKWSDVDLTGPVISGWVGKKSCYQGEPVWLCYSDLKDTYHFKDHVKAVDARDGKVPVSVDASRIRWNKEGVYKVYYTAKDKAGNKTKAWAKVQVCKPGTAERFADIILKNKVGGGSDVQKLRKIYQYVQGNCSYTGTGGHKDWRATAANGIRNHGGDCFTYYSVAKLLITRAGIPHIMVRRYPERAGNNHWWNLVYVKGGWYHFDTTPRTRKGYFCLMTDEQLHMYSTGSTFRFQEGLYPKRAKKKISRNPV